MKLPLLLAGASALGTLIALSIAAAPVTAPAGGTATYAITVTNLTRAQIFSPVLAASHAGNTGIFRAGMPASTELALLAEDGDNSLLSASLTSNTLVLDVASGGGMILPGQSETIMLQADPSAPFLSLAGMLVTSNDTFLGLDTVKLPERHSVLTATAYDAGTEFNSEKCMYIPGPPCGMGGMHDPTPAEGFVYVSNGIQGHADIDPITYDWRNPTARVEILRVN
jgi:hypothetical protein